MVERVGSCLYRVIGHMDNGLAVVEVVLLGSGSTPGVNSGSTPGANAGSTPGVNAGSTPGVDAEAVLLLLEGFVFHYWCTRCRDQDRGVTG